jgi:hypothetical protein
MWQRLISGVSRRLEEFTSAYSLGADVALTGKNPTKIASCFVDTKTAWLQATLCLLYGRSVNV